MPTKTKKYYLIISNNYSITSHLSRFRGYTIAALSISVFSQPSNSHQKFCCGEVDQQSCDIHDGSQGRADYHLRIRLHLRLSKKKEMSDQSYCRYLKCFMSKQLCEIVLKA